MSILIIKLTPHEIILLNEERILPKSHSYQLKKGDHFGFYCHRRLYGLYRIKSENQKYYFLVKNHYRPLRIFGGKKAQEIFFSQPHQVEMAWKLRSYLRDRLLMTSEEDHEKYSFTFHHHLLKNFKKTLICHKTSETEKLINQIQNILMSHNTSSLSELKGMGSRLFELGNFKEALPLISGRITYSPAPTAFPIEALYHQSTSPEHPGWVWRENPIHYFRRPNSIRHRLHSFTLFSTDEDPFMVEEQGAIKHAFEFKSHFSSQFLTGKQKEALLPAMESDILHLVAHGKTEGEMAFDFVYQDKSFFTLKDISQLPRTPALVFLSNCYSDHPRLRQAFFERGTQTLIVFQGPLFSSSLPQAMEGFYRRLLIEKMTVLESYHMLIRKLSQLNDINAIKIRLYGYAQERLYSFKR